MNDHDLPDEASLRSTLRALERSGTAPAGARDRVLQATLAAYDEDASGRNAASIDRMDIVEVAERRDRHREVGSRTRLAWLTAAAVAVIAMGSLLWVADGSDTLRIADVDQLDSGPVRVPAGRLQTDVLGTAMSFESDGRLWLIDEQVGSVVLAVDPEDPAASRIRFVRPTGIVSDLGVGSIGELFDGSDSRFGAQFQLTSIGAVETQSWRVRLSSESGLTAGCEPNAACLTVFTGVANADLVRTGWNDVFEIPQGAEDPIVILSTPSAADTSLDFGEPFQDLLDSVEFGEPKPNPLD